MSAPGGTTRVAPAFGGGRGPRFRASAARLLALRQPRPGRPVAGSAAIFYQPERERPSSA